MKVGLNFFPVRPAFFYPMVRRMDELGYDTVWMGEHLVFPSKIESPYPYDTSLAAPYPETPLYDPLITLATVAVQTRNLNIGTSVYVVPLRHPLVVARLAATLALLSEGRFLFGVGAGWLKEEFQASEQPWDHRGARLEEAIGVMRRLWSEPRVAHEGKYYRFEEVGFEPKPAMPIPVIMGGETEPAIRRAARIGDGWTGVDHTPETAAQRVKLLKELRGDKPRMDIGVDITVMPDLDTLLRFRDAGVDRLIMRNRMFASSDKSLEKSLDNLTRFAETAMLPAKERSA